MQAYTAAKKGDDVGAAAALVQLSALLQGLPVLQVGDGPVALIAEELAGWAERGVLQQLGTTAATLVEGSQARALVAAMLGLPTTLE